MELAVTRRADLDLHGDAPSALVIPPRGRHFSTSNELPTARQFRRAVAEEIAGQGVNQRLARPINERRDVEHGTLSWRERGNLR